MTDTDTDTLILDRIAVASRDEVNRIIAAVTQRRVELDRESMLDLRVGDRVVVSQTVSPKYFAGCLATVLEAPRGSRVKVQLDSPPWKAVPRYCKEDGVVNMLLSTLKAA